MRSIFVAFQLSLLLSTSVSAHPSDLSPFILAIDGTSILSGQNSTSSLSSAEKDTFDLLKRKNCPLTFNSCSAIVQTAACCSTDAICTLDNAGNAACCPIGSFC